MRLHALEKIGFFLMALSLAIVLWPLVDILKVPTYVLASIAALVAGAIALFTGQYLRHKR